jgi:hypothetical protein
MSQTRRLAAILAADVAGFRGWMGADEKGTPERLKALRRELVPGRALAQSQKYTEESVREAIVLLQRVLAIDASYAPAAAMIGWCRSCQKLQGWGPVSDAEIGEGLRLARKAIEGRRSRLCCGITAERGASKALAGSLRQIALTCGPSANPQALRQRPAPH